MGMSWVHYIISLNAVTETMFLEFEVSFKIMRQIAYGLALIGGKRGYQ